jgi:hypothetical protein
VPASSPTSPWGSRGIPPPAPPRTWPRVARGPRRRAPCAGSTAASRRRRRQGTRRSPHFVAGSQRIPPPAPPRTWPRVALGPTVSHPWPPAITGDVSYRAESREEGNRRGRFPCSEFLFSFNYNDNPYRFAPYDIYQLLAITLATVAHSTPLLNT